MENHPRKTTLCFVFNQDNQNSLFVYKQISSKGVNMNETHFDAIIVGSGFGGSVMAYRLAKADLRVCLLERGKSYPPGSFPRSPYGMKNNFWDPSEGKYGLFSLWSFPGLNALVSSGLGGG